MNQHWQSIIPFLLRSFHFLDPGLDDSQESDRDKMAPESKPSCVLFSNEILNVEADENNVDNKTFYLNWFYQLVKDGILSISW